MQALNSIQYIHYTYACIFPSVFFAAVASFEIGYIQTEA